MSSSIQMVAKIGDQTIRVGTCHPGQARILVKKEHARWDDGSLVLHLRPIHLQVAYNNPRLPLGEKEDEVSNAEVERRLDWFRTIMQAVMAGDTHGSDLEAIIGPQDPRAGLKHVANVIQETKGRDRFRVTFANMGPEDLKPPSDLTKEELAEWFQRGDTEPVKDADRGRPYPKELDSLWDRGVFQNTGEFYSVYGVYDSREAPIRTSEPPPLREPTDEDGIALNVVASITGETTPIEATVFQTELQEQEENSKLLLVKFALRTKRCANARWPGEYIDLDADS
jgi:hypothetical protein